MRVRAFCLFLTFSGSWIGGELFGGLSAVCGEIFAGGRGSTGFSGLNSGIWTTGETEGSVTTSVITFWEAVDVDSTLCPFPLTCSSTGMFEKGSDIRFFSEGETGSWGAVVSSFEGEIGGEIGSVTASCIFALVGACILLNFSRCLRSRRAWRFALLMADFVNLTGSCGTLRKY